MENEAHIIEESEMDLRGFSSADETGQVFVYKDKLLRGIWPSQVEHVRNLFKSKIMDALIQEKLIVEMKITSYQTAKFPLIIESKRIFPVTFAMEWSFDMLKDAALLLLRLESCLNQYGYTLKDWHADNIVFSEGEPVFVDLGSIVPFSGAPNRFGNTYYCKWVLPIAMMTHSDAIARIILLASTYIDANNVIRLYYGSGCIGKALANCWRVHFYLERAYFYRKLAGKYYEWKISSCKAPAKSTWSNYQNKDYPMDIFQLCNQEKKSYPHGFERFEKVVDVIKELPIDSVLEFGGNAGFLCMILSRFLKIKNYISTDYDAYAVNMLYNVIKKYKSQYPFLSKITPAVVDFTLVYKRSYQMPDFEERWKADLVLAMALTHHLLLSQYLNIDAMFERLARCTNRYLLIEFMPLGLWDGENAPELPSWYTLLWFQSHMEKLFTVLLVQQMEKNRIMLLGELISKE